MTEFIKLRLVTNRRGGTSLVYEGRAYKLRYTGKRVKNWGCSKDKKGCKGGVTTSLDATAVIRRTPHGDDCPVGEHTAYRMEKRAILKKRSAEEAKTIPQIYDEEAAVASAEPSTSGQFPFFREVRNAMYNQRANRFPRFPTDHQALVLGPEFTRTKSGKTFLLMQKEQGVMETLANQLLSRNPVAGSVRQKNNKYAKKQRRVMIYIGEYTSGRRTLERFLEALIYLTPQPI
ncbi:hypothetical protein T12_14761 [Trichinella patagoniensis]|uniref:FLYWCH-type domain-containing protein n=1 Tax=Trichinella patagoniensis TaxID=990121 RepID=A0A0V0ZM24_9BILA|nr:hypothetical protein T12_14761 [Trichinella patagoniensis]